MKLKIVSTWGSLPKTEIFLRAFGFHVLSNRPRRFLISSSEFFPTLPPPTQLPPARRPTQSGRVLVPDVRQVAVLMNVPIVED